MSQRNFLNPITVLKLVECIVLTLWLWQNSIALSTCHNTFLTVFSSRPLGYLSSSSSTVWSTNSNTRKRRFLRRKTSIKLTRLSCRNCWKESQKQLYYIRKNTNTVMSSTFKFIQSRTFTMIRNIVSKLCTTLLSKHFPCTLLESDVIDCVHVHTVCRSWFLW